MKILSEKQYAAFAANAKTLDSLRWNTVSCVPGFFEVTKIIVLTKEDFEKLSEDVSPEYPFLKDNQELMSADPGGLFRCLMVRAEGQTENMLIAQRKDTLYLGYGRDYRNVDLRGVPEERIALEEPKACREYAVFYHRPRQTENLKWDPSLQPEPERKARFQVEQVLPDDPCGHRQRNPAAGHQAGMFRYHRSRPSSGQVWPGEEVLPGVPSPFFPAGKLQVRGHPPQSDHRRCEAVPTGVFRPDDPPGTPPERVLHPSHGHRRLGNNVPNAATRRSLELGMIHCIDEVKKQVRRDMGLSVIDVQVERVLAEKLCSMDEDARDIIQKQSRLYTERLLSAAMEAGFDLKAIPVVMLGGSAAMVSTTSHKSVQQLVAHFGGMFELCRKKKIDLILTKSISRFARNTLDCIKHVRILKSWGIPVIFEKENIDTSNMNSEMILTCLSSFAQAESESLSGNVTKGIRMGYRQGRFIFRYKNFLGYRKGPDGEPEIVPEEAAIIRLIARNYLNGDSLRTIKATLESMGIPTATGNKNWSTETIQRILQNEKYMGDVLLQKTYTADFIEGKIKKNNGELPQYYIKDNHPAIIPREMFYQIQEEIARRKSKMPANAKKAKTNRGRFTSKYALSERLVCRDCGSYFRRVTWNIHGRKQIVWRCINRLEFGPKSCGNSPSLNETSLHAGGHPFPGSRMQGHLEEMASPPAGCTYTLHRWRKCHNQSSCDRKQTP